MSGSPKYTTIYLAAQRRAQLAAARQVREAERQRRAELARQRRVAAGVLAAQRRAAALTARLAALSAAAAALSQAGAVSQAGALSQAGELARESATASTLTRRIGAATDEGTLSQLRRELRDGERRLDKLSGAVARELTVREHAGAIEVVTGQLDTVADRERLDPAGFREVTELIAEAGRRVGDAKKFGAAYGKLSERADTHLERARDRQATLSRLANESDEVATRLTAVIDDATAVGVSVPGLDQVRQDLAALRGELDEPDVHRWTGRIAELNRAGDEMSAAVDARLDQLDRMSIVVEAASKALPQAGLRVLPASLAERDDAVTFRAERTDGSSIELIVYAGDERGSRLEYRTEGSDFAVEQLVDGEVRRCDLTEQLLTQFHTELERQGVHADGLHWEGKPKSPRPPVTGGVTVRADLDRGNHRSGS